MRIFYIDIASVTGSSGVRSLMRDVLFVINRKTIHGICAVLLIIVMTAFFAFAPYVVYAAHDPHVKIGHALRGEKGSLKGNKPGDQTGNEICIEDWSYSVFSASGYHWKYVLRAKDHDLARAVAEHMKEICSNDKIGYDQNEPDCTTLYEEAKKNDWDISGIRKKCETTCSDAISVCLNAEGVKISKTWNTSRMKQDLEKTGEFECFDSKDYTKSSKKLVVGDILLYPGRHAAVVVESDNPFMYKLTYLNKKGKTVSIEIEENKYVQINPNNSSEVRRIKMNGDLDISDEEAALKNHTFAGWEKTGTRTLTACYKPMRQKMKLVTEKVKITNK